MKITTLIILLINFTFFNSNVLSQNYRTEHQETVNYIEGANNGSIKFKVVFDAFMGEATVTVVAKVDAYENCKPSLIDISIDIYSGNNKVSNKTFTNLINVDIAGSPSWDDLFPGLSAEEAKNLYKSGFSIRNVRVAKLSFSGCKENEETKKNDSPTNSSQSQTSNQKSISEENENTRKNNERLAQEKKVEEARKEAEAKKKAQEEEARKKAEEEAARKEQERRAENLRKKQEYDRRIQEQNSRNTQAAGAMAASSMGAMTAIAMVVYADMGRVSPRDTYIGNQFYGGIDMGYSISSIPMVFNSHRITYVYYYNTGNSEYITTKQDDERRASTINLEFKPFLGFESENIGAEVFGCFQPGMSIIFDRFNLSHYIGGKVYGGLPNVKFFYEYNRGVRRFNASEWIDSEEFGNGVIRYSNKKNIIGARFTFTPSGYSYSRHHIHFGYIMENFIEGLSHDSGKTNLWFYNLDETLKSNKNKYYRIKGWHFSWNKEHNFNLFANIYPDHPFAGISKYSESDSFSSRTQGSIFLEIGFVRQIKTFF